MSRFRSLFHRKSLEVEVSKDLLLQAGEYALSESRAGRCIPHAKAMQMIKERMGWK